MPRTHGKGGDDDDESIVTINFKDVKSSRHGDGERSVAQHDQLARAREVALNNRRVKLRAKLEARLLELRSIMGDQSNEQLIRAVKHLTETEDRLRTKQAALTEKYNEQVKQVYDELRSIRKAMEATTGGKRIVPLSQVSSTTASASKK